MTPPSDRRSDATLVAHAGRPAGHDGAVNVPVYHASTILFPTLEGYERKAEAPVRYGRRGTPTTQAFERAVAALEGVETAALFPSGLSAVTSTLLAHAGPGAELLLPDTIYPPARKFCHWLAEATGTRTRFYDPLDSSTVTAQIGPKTRLIWLESPGSHTFEIQDIPAITEIGRAAGIPTAIDNSWSGGHFLKPARLGVDLIVHAATKYIGGHSDVMSGVVAGTAAAMAPVRQLVAASGLTGGPDDAYLALRGLRTLVARLERHQTSAITVGRWLETRPEVSRVLHPALPSHPQHALWQQQFTGASGLFGFVLAGPPPRTALAAMLDGMQLFGMGSSWGGYESLLIPVDPTANRTVTPWREPGQLMRIHVGLEDPADLISDLEAGFARAAANRAD